MNQTSITLTLGALLACLVTATPALAQDNGGADSGQQAEDSAPSYKNLSTAEKKELANLIEAGKSAYDRGDFEKSLRYFQDAHDIFAHPDLLYRIGLSYERLGEDQQALHFYRTFLEKVPDARERGRIEKQIRVIEERLAQRASKIRVDTDPKGAVVYINDEINGPAGYTPTELPVSAGNYKVIIKKKGYQKLVEQIDVPEGQTVQLKFPLQPIEQSDGKRDRGSGARVSAGPYLMGGLGLLATGATIYTFTQYSDRKNRIERWDASRDNESRPDNYDETYNEMQTYGAATVIGGIVAAGALTWGVVWLVNDLERTASRDGAPAGTSFAVSPMIAPDGRAGGITFTTSF